MARVRRTLDGQPGRLPDIRTGSGGITFVIVPAGTDGGERLVIRCDPKGDVWMSIQPDVAPPGNR